MQIRKLGYACINEVLNKGNPRISTSRTIRKKTFEKYGMSSVADKAHANLKDLLKILHWNEQNGIKLFRMSSDLFPWKSEWEWHELPNLGQALKLLDQVGDFAKKHNHRLTLHPGHFNKLCSPDQRVLNNTIAELEAHSQLMNYIGLPLNHYCSINIHVGAAYGDKQTTLDRFCKNFEKLSTALQRRLTVENDDKGSLYTTKELYENVYKKTGIPIMFDFHHHDCNSKEQLTKQQAANLAIKTWPNGITPLFHWSEPRSIEKGDKTIKQAAHSDLCHGPLPSFKLTKQIDLMIEAKKKERSMSTLKNSQGNYVHNQKLLVNYE